MIVSLHVTHSSAGVSAMNDVRSVMETNLQKHLGNVMENNEHIILRTCNRFEIYVGTGDPEKVRRDMEAFVNHTVPYSKGRSMPFIFQGKDSIRHLFRVSCGLDSLMVGEDHIQGQVRNAYICAKEEGHVSKYLSKLFDRALSIGKKVRSRSGCNDVSVGSAAVEVAERILGGLKGKTVTVIGSGSVGASIAKGLSGKGQNTVFISNRTFERAVRLAELTEGTAVGLDHLGSAMAESDVIFVATSAPHVIVTREMMMSASEQRRTELLIMDVSVPSNIGDSSGIQGIRVETMDGFQAVALENITKRKREITEAERIISDELERMEREEREQKANEVISGISRKAAAIREEELSKAMVRAKFTDVTEILDDLSRAIVSRILSDTYGKLREASLSGRDEICETATDLFGLEVEGSYRT